MTNEDMRHDERERSSLTHLKNQRNGLFVFLNHSYFAFSNTFSLPARHLLMLGPIWFIFRPSVALNKTSLASVCRHERQW